MYFSYCDRMKMRKDIFLQTQNNRNNYEYTYETNTNTLTITTLFIIYPHDNHKKKHVAYPKLTKFYANYTHTHTSKLPIPPSLSTQRKRKNKIKTHIQKKTVI